MLGANFILWKRLILSCTLLWMDPLQEWLHSKFHCIFLLFNPFLGGAVLQTGWVWTLLEEVAESDSFSYSSCESYYGGAEKKRERKGARYLSAPWLVVAGIKMWYWTASSSGASKCMDIYLTFCIGVSNCFGCCSENKKFYIFFSDMDWKKLF